ncbi:MAG: gfo/Idh/MocA family oxidoreductase, partial [Clostridia bacterium]|nr:gfo/Idh/MocA family oxidoreductase [Clostridia bacterium]
MAKNVPDKFNLGFIGFGQRGPWLVATVLDTMPDVNVTAVCDAYQDRVDGAAAMIKDKRSVVPFQTTDYHEILTR